MLTPERNIFVINKKTSGRHDASLRRLAYELAEAMLEDFDKTWYLAFMGRV